MEKGERTLQDAQLSAPAARTAPHGLGARSVSRRIDQSGLRARAAVDSAARSGQAWRRKSTLQHTHVATPTGEPHGLPRPARLTVDLDRLFFTSVESGVVWPLPNPVAQTFRPILRTNLAIPWTTATHATGTRTLAPQPGVQQGSPISSLLFALHTTQDPRARVGAPAAAARGPSRATRLPARALRRE